MSDDQLRAKSLAVFHALVSTWSNDLRKEVSGLQDELLKRLDALQDQMSNYDENIDEERILTFVREVSNLAGGGGGGGDGGGSSLKILRQSLRKIDDGTSLTEVLTLLLEELSQFAPRVALFILKGGSCIGWNGRGFNDSPGFNDEGIKRISVPTTADTVFSDVIKSRSSFVGESNKHPDNIQLLSRVGNVLPSSMFATPLVLHDRIAAIVYADSGDGPDPLQETEALEILTAYSSKLLDALSAQKSAAVKTGEHMALPATPPPPAAPEPVPGPPITERPAVPSPDVANTGDGESGTIMFNSADLAALRPVTDAPTPTAVPDATPAPDLDSMDSDTRKKHEEAMRFARLLVSEIKLYNEAKVQEGRSHRGIYRLLRDDIERSRQLYKERVPEPVRSQSTYFNDELIRILADGDSGAMGQGLPG